MQQTLIITTSLILTGLAVAFAFRCGLFNIGGTGPVHRRARCSGSGSAPRFEGMNSFLHILIAVVRRLGRRRDGPGIAGFLKATVGAHEVISTIMLNWIAIWVGRLPVRARRAAAERHAGVRPDLERRRCEGAKLPVFWGDPLLQGLHVGFFIALGALVVYWLLLNRTTLGYGVRAVGFNPEAARYGGISVSRNYFLAMAISGAFAGLAGAVDVLGWQFRLGDGRRPGASPIGVRRHRRGAARAQHRDRRRSRGAALRRAPHRNVDAEPRSRDLQARAGVEPDAR